MTLAPLDPGADLARWIGVLAPARQLADVLANTEFVPGPMRGKPDAITAAILYGDEIGVGPMQALQGIDVVDGRPRPSAELVRALILRAGHSFIVHEMTGVKCRVSGLRAGEPESARVYVEWTLDMARSAGLAGRKNWREYPRAMLVARATGDLGRIKFPDVIKGLGFITEEDPGSMPMGTEPEVAPPPPRPPVARKLRPREAPELATPERPAPDGSVDVPLPEPEPEPEPEPGPEAEAEQTAEDAFPPVAPGDQPAKWPRPGPDPWLRTEDMEPEAPPPEPPPDDEDEPPPPAPIGEAPRRAIFSKLGVLTGHASPREERLAICSAIVGRDVPSSTALTRAEGYEILSWLDRAASGAVGWTVDPHTGAVTLHTYRDD